MSTVRAFNSALAFLLELALLAAFAYWGFRAAASGPLRVALGIGVPLAVAVFWGIFVAPKARIRLPPALKLIFAGLLFALAAAALLLSGQRTLGVVLAALYVVNRLVALVR